MVGYFTKIHKIFQGADPVCQAVESPKRRFSARRDNIPSYDPYIPRSYSLFYNCSSVLCEPLQLTSLIQLTSPNTNLKSCYTQAGNFECEQTRFHYFKSIDKLLFLEKNMPNKTFYLVDCLVFHEGGRLCHKKVETEYPLTHTRLKDFAGVVRPNETYVLSQNEFLCEESDNKEVNCDLDPYIPFDEGLKIKASYKVNGDVLLNALKHVLVLKHRCIDSWCGFSGQAPASRRSDWFSRYEPPGGKIFRCYYAKRQQVCKQFGDSYVNSVAANSVNNWLNS